MVEIYVCEACRNGQHTQCLGNTTLKEGVYGGSCCSCCGDITQEEREAKERDEAE